jgi:release factor glutamine methyltransferase
VPAEDTQLLAECVRNYRGKWALEIGIGSGTVAQALAENFDSVTGSDIDLASLKYCYKSKNNAIALVCCDAASAFRGKFDLIVSNPPYLPDDTVKDATVHGGPKGIEKTIHFIKSALPLLADGGRILVLVSSLADQSLLDLFVQERKLKKKVVKEKVLFYERLSVLELTF